MADYQGSYTGQQVDAAIGKAHEHSNKALLDTYTQTEADIADAVSKKHTHSNKALLDSYTQTEANIADAVSKKHSHSNKSVLDAITDVLTTAWSAASTWVATNGTTVLNHLADAVKHITALERSTWNGKQDALVSGTNLKTINNQSLLGSGNIDIQGGGTSDFDALSNRPSYNGSAMSHSTNIPEVKTAAWDGKYSKPSGGIPSTDMSSDVQTSLGKADSALQSHQSLAAYRTAAQQDAIHDSTKQDVIDSSHKLSADNVDDAATTNKFVSAADKTSWNGKAETFDVTFTQGQTIEQVTVLTADKTIAEVYAAIVAGKIVRGSITGTGYIFTPNSYAHESEGTAITMSYGEPGSLNVIIAGINSEGNDVWYAHEDNGFVGATSSSGGQYGYVPAPASGDQAKALFGDASWKPVMQPVSGTHTNEIAILDSGGNVQAGGKTLSDLIEQPAVAGTDGQVLTSDGQGGVAWETPQGGGSDTSTIQEVSATALTDLNERVERLNGGHLRTATGFKKVLTVEDYLSIYGVFATNLTTNLNNQGLAASQGKYLKDLSDVNEQILANALVELALGVTIWRNIAAEFSPSTAYNVGDYCFYSGILYRCTTSASASPTFDNTKFAQTTVMAELIRLTTNA